MNGMNLILRKSERNVTPPYRISNKRGNWNYNDAISYQSSQEPLIPTNTYLQTQAHTHLCSGVVPSLVMAKTRSASIKKLTLPQLELMAALIGARLANYICHSLCSRFNDMPVTLWSDSTIVLHWLNSSKSLKLFTATQVREMIWVLLS